MTPEKSMYIGERNKVCSLEDAANFVREEKEKEMKAGLITGGFDIIHKGHISLFRFAKVTVDVLVVGVEQDETLMLSKGQNRPINNLAARCDFLQELNSIDYVFAIPFVIRYEENEKIDDLYANMYGLLQPGFLVNSIPADRFWKRKKKIAENMKIRFIEQEI